MMTAAIALLAGSLSAAGGTPTPTPEPISGPTFCVEWIHQSSEGYDRLTLFRDRTLVWKTHRGEHDDIKRERLSASEAQYYCDYFEHNEFWSISPDLRTGMLSDLAGESAVTMARTNGNRKTIRYDDLSSHTASSASLRAALEGLKGIFLSPLSPASRYTPDVLAPGTLLKRFDGAVFRVNRLEKDTGFVEIVGVTEPYSQFVKIEELRFQFAPPERAP
jgi:hypothetical protein